MSSLHRGIEQLVINACAEIKEKAKKDKIERMVDFVLFLC